jgi:hypothetical protein
MPSRLSAKHRPSVLRRPDVVFALFMSVLIVAGLLARVIGLLPLQ